MAISDFYVIVITVMDFCDLVLNLLDKPKQTDLVGDFIHKLLNQLIFQKIYYIKIHVSISRYKIAYDKHPALYFTRISSIIVPYIKGT